MTRIFSTDIEIAGTVYVKANSKAEAIEKVKQFIAENTCLEVEPDGDTISDRQYDDEELPEASLSPAMTLRRIYNQRQVEEK